MVLGFVGGGPRAYDWVAGDYCLARSESLAAGIAQQLTIDGIGSRDIRIIKCLDDVDLDELEPDAFGP